MIDEAGGLLALIEGHGAWATATSLLGALSAWLFRETVKLHRDRLADAMAAAAAMQARDAAHATQILQLTDRINAAQERTTIALQATAATLDGLRQAAQLAAFRQG